MKKTICALGIILGLSLNSVFATEVACVDVQQVVNASKQVQALKKEQELKVKEMVKFVEKARKDVANVKDPGKKQALEEKYNKEFAVKKEKAEKEYTEKLQKIETSISSVIAQQAKAKGYNMVITKSNVLYSDTDMTEVVIKAVAEAEKPKAEPRAKYQKRRR